jgi:MFS family permease
MSLLTARPPYRGFFIARAVSVTGDRAALVAVLVYGAARQDAAIVVSLILLAYSLPSIFAPLSGALADRVDKRRAMVYCNILQLVFFSCVAALLPPVAFLLALLLAAAAVNTVFVSAATAAIPQLAGMNQLVRANAWNNIAMNIQAAAGPIVGGVFTQVLGVRGVLWIDAGTFLASAVLLARLPSLPPAGSVGQTAAMSFAASVARGIRYVYDDPLFRVLAIALFLIYLCGSLDNVALVLLVRHTLRASATMFGLAAAAYGVGMVAASIPIARRGRMKVMLGFLAGWALVGAATAVTGVAPDVAMVLICQLGAGTGNAFANVGRDTLIQSRAQPELRGRALGGLSATMYAAVTLAYAVGGPALAATGPRFLFVVAGTAIVVTVSAVGRALVRLAATPGTA